MKPLNQSFSVSYSYTVSFVKGLFQADNTALIDLFSPHEKPPKVVIVLDSGVSVAHPNLISQIKKYADSYRSRFDLVDDPLVIPGGEQCKNHQISLERILSAVNEKKIDRHSYIVAIGGGAVLDLAGYAAAIAHRGIRHVRVPTTTLSQNDSGVGVKNGINAFGKKNFIGTFAPPVAVINDSSFLTTLEIRDWRAGIAEAIKVSLIKDKGFFIDIKNSVDLLMQRDLGSMERLIYRCAQLHMQHIAMGDPFEQGSSRPLDFGHWAAHKLEQLTKFDLRHGEAVALGIALDVAYSHLIGKLTQDDLLEVLILMRQLGFNLYHDQMSDPQLFDGLKEFQEHLGGKMTIMLLEDIGRGIEVHDMDHTVISRSVELLYQYHHHNSLSA